MPQHTLIIAEAGVNHNGSIELARRLVDAAVEARADIVKFQTFVPELIVSATAAKADYQARNCGAGETQLDMLRRISLTYDEHRELMSYCAARGIEYLSTAFDLPSVDFLHELGCRLWKIPSGEITNYPYLVRIASYGRPVIMSTGMCSVADIDAAIDTLTGAGLPRRLITLLHCNTQYPTPMADVNLLAMQAMRERYGLPVGYSDHTPGIEVPVAAVALGAPVIEKHFTLSRTMDGPDHRASLEAAELAAMVSAIRNIELALGSPDKHVSDSERPNSAVARKSIVAACDIRRGDIFSDTNLTARRPGDGLSPMLWPRLIGRPAPRDYAAGEQIDPGAISD